MQAIRRALAKWSIYKTTSSVKWSTYNTRYRQSDLLTSRHYLEPGPHKHKITLCVATFCVCIQNVCSCEYCQFKELPQIFASHSTNTICRVVDFPRTSKEFLRRYSQLEHRCLGHTMRTTSTYSVTT